MLNKPSKKTSTSSGKVIESSFILHKAKKNTSSRLNMTILIYEVQLKEKHITQPDCCIKFQFNSILSQSS